MNNIKIGKLTDKEFIIGRENNIGDFEDVLSIVIARKSGDAWSIAMTDFMAPFSANPRPIVNIKKHHILSSVDATDDLSKKYIEVTSGLILPV